jgi:aromatic ring-opening dioxygenase catalytic subunit (LigB family)
MLYDYYGFPPEAYRVEWPAPGAPEVAQEVRALLEKAGIASAEDAERGFDHGVFVPLKLGYPNADVPTLQLSLVRGLEPARHIAIGRALEPLREQGVFIVGSGMSYHNMRGLLAAAEGAPTPKDESKAFDAWLEQALSAPADRRERELLGWEGAPRARACHPREEHLIPLHVIAGAAGNDAASLPYRDVVMGVHLSSVHFG